jgi:hypothetical protein
MLNGLLGGDWVEWPTGFGYYWVADMNKPSDKPELKYVAPASYDCPFELWDCPGIGRSRIYEIGSRRYMEIKPPNSMLSCGMAN